MSVLNCGKRLEAMKLVITSVRPRTRLLEQGGGGGAEQALGFASLYYNRHCCQYYIHQHHQQHHHFPKHGCDDPFKNRAFGALSSVGSMTELPWHSNNNVLLVLCKGIFWRNSVFWLQRYSFHVTLLKNNLPFLNQLLILVNSDMIIG